MELIKDSSELKQLCNEFSKSRYVTVDTEFIRETTFWPKLCLIQLAMPGKEALIDPLADGLDLSPFYALMTNRDVIKVMHGCRQDIEIFYYLAKIIPEPLADTQVMGMVCGFGDAAGYETLVRKVANTGIDKGSRFTDWSMRPLSDKQTAYALADVTHLRDIFEKLEATVNESGRQSWLAEEMAILTNPETHEQKPENAWKRLRFQDKRARVMGVITEVSAWREIQAQKRNIPRNRILKDDAIREIALQGPKDETALDKLRGVPNGFIRSRNAAGLMDAIRKGQKANKEDLPPLPAPVDNRPGIGPLVELLKVLLKHVCETHGVAPKLIANVADLERIASDDAPAVKALGGWRREVFGDSAMALKNGKLAIGCRDDKVILIENS